MALAYCKRGIYSIFGASWSNVPVPVPDGVDQLPHCMKHDTLYWYDRQHGMSRKFKHGEIEKVTTPKIEFEVAKLAYHDRLWCIGNGFVGILNRDHCVKPQYSMHTHFLHSGECHKIGFSGDKVAIGNKCYKLVDEASVISGSLLTKGYTYGFQYEVWWKDWEIMVVTNSKPIFEFGIYRVYEGHNCAIITGKYGLVTAKLVDPKSITAIEANDHAIVIYTAGAVLIGPLRCPELVEFDGSLHPPTRPTKSARTQ